MIDMREARKKKGLTLYDLSEKVGVSVSGLSLIERRKREPSVRVAKRLAEVLGVKWTEFFE